MGKKVDLTGKRFGKLIVIEESGDRASNGSIIWKCKCDCENIKYTTSSDLNAGRALSCGCQNNLIGNRFGKLIVVDKADYKKENYLTYKCKCDCGNMTYVRSISLTKGSTKSCGCIRNEKSKSRGVKNIAHPLKHNYDEELKEGTALYSLTQAIGKNNTTGIKGVSYCNTKNKFRAYIMIKRKNISLGYFNTLEEASQARKEAEEKYFNPILEKYGRLSNE